MELSIATPALLFPAISLLMLAYTNRFLALASLIRGLHEKYLHHPEEKHLVEQIKNLRIRTRLIRSMQLFGVISFLFCVICMYCIFREWPLSSYWSFGASILSFMISLILSLIEISISMRALELAISDMESIIEANPFKQLLKSDLPGKQK